ncbi:MAG: penicillin-binding protein activator LpoB [Candidatus Omnitrophica bacterium]|nr:penicillin-binding protein activator LpoB [Candidatus Omnitrophota bacterium]
MRQWSCVIVVVMVVVSVSSCASTGNDPHMRTMSGAVKRIDVDSSYISDVTTDSQDLRSICQTMARSIINLYQIANAVSPPRIAFLEMVNRTTEDIDSYNLLDSIRTQLVKNSGGRVIFIDRERINAIMREREMKRSGTVGSSAPKVLSGVDYFLTGRAYSDMKAFKGMREAYYRFSFRLTDAESGDIIWEDEYEFKKAGRLGFMNR